MKFRFFPVEPHQHLFVREKSPERLAVKYEGKWLLLDRDYPDHNTLIEAAWEKISKLDKFRNTVFSIKLKDEEGRVRIKIKTAPLATLRPVFSPFAVFMENHREEMPEKTAVCYGNRDIFSVFHKGGYLFLNRSDPTHQKVFAQIRRDDGLFDEENMKQFFPWRRPVKALKCAKVTLSLRPFKTFAETETSYPLKYIIPFKRPPLDTSFGRFSNRVINPSDAFLKNACDRVIKCFQLLAEESKENLRKLSPPASSAELLDSLERITQIVKAVTKFSRNFGLLNFPHATVTDFITLGRFQLNALRAVVKLDGKAVYNTEMQRQMERVKKRMRQFQAVCDEYK